MTALSLLVALLGLTPLSPPELGVPRAPVESTAGLADRVPATTHLYAAFPSLGEAWRGFQTLPLYQAYRDEEVQAFLETLGDGLGDPFPGVRWEFIEQLLDLPAIFDGEVAFALVDPDKDDWVLSLGSSDPGAKGPAGVRESEDPHAGVNRFAKALGSILEGFFSGELEPIEIAGARVRRFTGPFSDCLLATRGGGLWLSTRKDRLESVLLGTIPTDQTLSASKPFRDTATGTIGKDTSFLLYVPLGLLRDEALEEMHAQDRVPIESAGLDGIQGLMASLAMRDGRAHDRLRLQIEGERRGLLDGVDRGPIDPAVARLAPSNTVLLFAGNLRLQSLYETLVAMAREDRTGLLRGLRDPEGEFTKELGIRSLSELVSSLGSELIAFASLPAGGFIPKALLAVEVLRPEELQSDLAAVFRTLTGAEPKTIPYRSRQISYIPASSSGSTEINPCWCVTDGYLLVSYHPTIIKEAIGRMERGGGLDDDTDFRAAWEKLPAAAGAVAYANTKRLFQYAYGALLSIAPLAGVDLPFDPAAMPTSEAITTYVSFGLSGLVADRRGLEVLTDSDGYGPTSIALYGLAVAAVWAPFENWSRTLDDWPCCGSVMEQIHDDLEARRQEHQAYPDHLAELARADPRWRSDNCPGASQSEFFSLDEQQPYETFTYVIEAKKIPAPERFPEDWMIVWDNKPRHNDGRVVLLGTGKVIWLTEDAFQRRLAEQEP